MISVDELMTVQGILQRIGFDELKPAFDLLPTFARHRERLKYFNGVASGEIVCDDRTKLVVAYRPETATQRLTLEGDDAKLVAAAMKTVIEWKLDRLCSELKDLGVGEGTEGVAFMITAAQKVVLRELGVISRAVPRFPARSSWIDRLTARRR